MRRKVKTVQQWYEKSENVCERAIERSGRGEVEWSEVVTGCGGCVGDDDIHVITS